MTDRILLSKAHVTEIEEKLVLEALRSDWVAPAGPMIDQFESEVATRVGVAHAVALSSGTAALHLALLELGAGPDKAVIVPSMTFAASANAVLYTGADPVFVDCQRSDANVDPGCLIEAVKTLRAEGKDIVAAMTVDLYGRACDYEAIVPALAELEVPLIEDAAEALGAAQNGKGVGSFGRAAALSFNGNKIMTTSGGGMLVSDDEHLINRARYLSTQARQPAPWYEHTEMGFNYRMSNILAALGVGQLSRLDEMIARRRAHRDRYEQALGGIDGVRVLSRGEGLSDSEDNCWLTSIILDPSKISTTPDDIVKTLDGQGIEARHLWKPMHMQPLFANARVFSTGGAEELFANGVNLPSGSELEDADIDRVVAALTPLLTQTTSGANK